MTDIEKKVETLVTPVINQLGYEVYDVIYEKEAQDYYLRIFIDKPEGIDLNDCEKVNDSITNLLDESNYIKNQYFLEVSSPGIERIIRQDKHYQANINKEIYVKLFKPINIMDKKIKELIGILNSFDKEYINIEIKEQDEIIKINKKDIANIKTVYHWE